MGTRFKEHTSRKGTNKAMKEHLETTGHACTLHEVRILDKEEDWFKRKVKEAIYIHKHRPSLNRDKGLELPLSTLHSCHMTRMGHMTPQPKHNATEEDAVMEI